MTESQLRALISKLSAESMAGQHSSQDDPRQSVATLRDEDIHGTVNSDKTALALEGSSERPQGARTFFGAVATVCFISSGSQKQPCCNALVYILD